MKRNVLHIILSLFFSAIFMFAGTGYNLIQYCCDDCEDVGITMAAEMSCESVHEHYHHCDNIHIPHSEIEMLSSMNELNKGCDIERLTVDVPSIQIPNHEITNYSLLFLELIECQAVMFSDSGFLSKFKQNHTLPDIPISLNGRQILSKISILII